MEDEAGPLSTSTAGAGTNPGQASLADAISNARASVAAFDGAGEGSMGQRQSVMTEADKRALDMLGGRRFTKTSGAAAVRASLDLGTETGKRAEAGASTSLDTQGPGSAPAAAAVASRAQGGVAATAAQPSAGAQPAVGQTNGSTARPSWSHHAGKSNGGAESDASNAEDESVELLVVRKSRTFPLA